VALAGLDPNARTRMEVADAGDIAARILDRDRFARSFLSCRVAPRVVRETGEGRKKMGKKIGAGSRRRGGDRRRREHSSSSCRRLGRAARPNDVYRPSGGPSAWRLVFLRRRTRGVIGYQGELLTYTRGTAIHERGVSMSYASIQRRHPGPPQRRAEFNDKKGGEVRGLRPLFKLGIPRPG